MDHSLLGFRVLNSLNIPLSVETVCVFTAPIFSAFASWATYLLTKVCKCQNCSLYIFAVVYVLANLLQLLPFVGG